MENVKKNTRCMWIPGLLKACGQFFLPLDFSCCNHTLWGLPSTKDLQPFAAGGAQIWLSCSPEWFSKILSRPQTFYSSVFCECLQFKAKMGADCILRATFISSQSALVLLAVHKVSLWLAIETLSKSKAMKYNLKVSPNSTEFSEEEKNQPNCFHFKWI